MPSFDEIKPGARLKGLDPAGIAEVVSVSKFGSDAINLVFRVDGRVAERLAVGFKFKAYMLRHACGLLTTGHEAVNASNF